MVIHLVHQAFDSQFGVLGILFEASKETPFIQKFWPLIPKHLNEKFTDSHTKLNVRGLLPKERRYF